MLYNSTSCSFFLFPWWQWMIIITVVITLITVFDTTFKNNDNHIVYSPTIGFCSAFVISPTLSTPLTRRKQIQREIKHRIILSSSSKSDNTTPIQQQQNNNSNNNDVSISSTSTKRNNIHHHRHHYPNHIAFICDGNSRWSLQNQKFMNYVQYSNNKSLFGHSKGAANVVNLIQYIQKQYSESIHYVTMYAFSTENWSRDEDEIKDLWKVMENLCMNDRFYDWVINMKVRIRIIGNLSDERIPSSLRRLLEKLEIDSHTSFERQNQDLGQNQYNHDGLTVCIAINYGGRKDIINASLKMAELISRGEISLQQLYQNENIGEEEKSNEQYQQLENDEMLLEQIFRKLLCTSDIPDPDLVIRTGGEHRLSNFLIWNAAYSELYFTDALWPDFDEKKLDAALRWYQGRERRFGGRIDQSN